jgi:arabinofuranosyltransferase
MSKVGSVGESRFPRWAWICLAAATLALLVHEVIYYGDLGGDAVDDAYISFRYAQNLVAGHGLVFNPGERVEGYTNFLWTMILALFMRLGLEPSFVAIALGVAFSLGTLWLLYLFWGVVRVGSPTIPVVAAWCLALDGSVALWAVSGMETSMFAFLVLAALTAYFWEWEKDRPGFLSGVLLALAAMTRPEGVLVLVVVVMHQAVARLAWRRQLFAPADVARAGIFLGLYLPYFLWRYYYYGFLLPNTFYVKVTVHDTVDQYERGLQYIATFGRLHLGLTLPVFILIPLLKRRLTFWFTALLAMVVSYGAYVAYVGGDWSVGRFFVPIMPAVYILASAGAVEAYESVKGWLGRLAASNAILNGMRYVAVSFLALGGALLLASSSLHGEHELFVARFQAARATHARVTLGKWLHENVPADTYIGVDAAGQIPYYAGLRTLDMFGVNDVHTAHLGVESMGQGVPGHEKFDFDYIMWRRPDLIIATAPFLEGSAIYQRIEVPWTDDPTLYGFLFLYRRKEWSGWG